jgi:glycine cleavage system aminomethyltransferase T
VRAWLAAVARHETPIDADPQAALLPQARVRDLTDPAAGPDQRTAIALHGPQAAAALRRALLPHERPGFARLRPGEILRQSLAGCDLLIARGDMGEESGFELYVHPEQVAALWRLLLEAGAPLGLLPAGLAARDLVRIEAGLPLHGRDLAGPHAISPLGAGCGALVKLHKPFFVGRAALLAREAARTHTLVRFGVVGRGRRVIRAGQTVLDRDGAPVGVVTSAAVCADGQVGLAYLLESCAAPGTPIQVLAPRAHDPSTATHRVVPAAVTPHERGAGTPPSRNCIPAMSQEAGSQGHVEHL